VRGKLLTTSRFLDNNPHKLIRLEDGREVLVPRQLLKPNEDGSFLLTAPLSEILSDTTVSDTVNDPIKDQRDAVIPVVQEELDVGTRQVESGRIRVNKRVETTESIIDEPLLRRSYDIQRTAVNRIIDDEAPKPRYDGDTLVLPVLEEVLVVEKRLILREEIRITRTKEETHDPQTHTVRREHVAVERI
jgi:uncharacterized protein (TIGR02271 family)